MGFDFPLRSFNIIQWGRVLKRVENCRRRLDDKPVGMRYNGFVRQRAGVTQW